MNTSELTPYALALTLRVHASHAKGALQQRLSRTSQIALSSHTAHGDCLQLRPPRLSDAYAWRAARLSSRHSIEPFWAASNTPWEYRHTDVAWAHEVRNAHHAARARKCLSFVIDRSGHFEGQLLLDNIDMFNHTAEMSIWTRHDTPPGTAHTAATLLLSAAFTTLELRRVSAPIHPDNRRAQRFAERVGLLYEGRMRDYFTTATGRADHLLYAITHPAAT
ncbi:MAG: GNAT family N-acetyltransferase [Gordonia polyisoprenivorans]|nr:GNAT family N-acetyltransferase [Gordonia polyisoprenivorans]